MDPERMQEHATEAFQFVQTVHEILPAWVQVGGLVLIGLACIGGAYALWRMFCARRRKRAAEQEREEIRIANRELRCDYCGEILHAPYWSWSEWARDVRDLGVSLEHILARCDGVAPKTPLDVLEARIDARVALERKRISEAKTIKIPVIRIYKGGANPCAPCQRVV